MPAKAPRKKEPVKNRIATRAYCALNPLINLFVTINRSRLGLDIAAYFWRFLGGLGRSWSFLVRLSGYHHRTDSRAKSAGNGQQTTSTRRENELSLSDTSRGRLMLRVWDVLHRGTKFNCKAMSCLAV